MPEPTEVTTGQMATWLNVHEDTEDALLLADSGGECDLFTIRGREVDTARGSCPSWVKISVLGFNSRHCDGSSNAGLLGFRTTMATSVGALL